MDDEHTAIDSLGQVHHVPVIDTTKPTPQQPVTLALTDDRIKEVIDSIDFKKMVTADDLFYLIARAVEREVLNQQEK